MLVLSHDLSAFWREGGRLIEIGHVLHAVERLIPALVLTVQLTCQLAVRLEALDPLD